MIQEPVLFHQWNMTAWSCGTWACNLYVIIYTHYKSNMATIEFLWFGDSLVPLYHTNPDFFEMRKKKSRGGMQHVSMSCYTFKHIIKHQNLKNSVKLMIWQTRTVYIIYTIWEVRQWNKGIFDSQKKMTLGIHQRSDSCRNL